MKRLFKVLWGWKRYKIFFCKPFRFEKYNYTFRNLMTSVEERMEFLKLVKEVMGMDCSNLVPLPWLKPKAEFIKSELYE